MASEDEYVHDLGIFFTLIHKDVVIKHCSLILCPHCSSVPVTTLSFYQCGFGLDSG